jgi:hypothetical protein
MLVKGYEDTKKKEKKIFESIAQHDDNIIAIVMENIILNF